ncbi:MAG TPA: SigE family RNA polymerase sigma factor [Nocardioides sp.]|jgi:RNA polymerase sigma-70 factor (sigma-E family)
MNRRDEDAFTEFAAAARPQLRGTAYLLCGDWHQASDHVQEGLIRVYVAWPRLRRQGSELNYARRCVVSAFLDSRRKRSSRELPTDDHERRDAHPDLADEVVTRESLMRALARLPERQRACVVLRYFDDLSVAETAAALGCSEGNVKSQTSRAIDSLRSMFAGTSLGELLTISGRTGSW